MSYIEIAKKAAYEAGEMLRKYLGEAMDYEYKYKNSMVTEVDTKSERLIVDIIRARFPTHGIYAEEFGVTDPNSEFRWIIDPLDGTTNYIHAYPFFTISIALEIRGEVGVGVVYDPVRDEMFEAQRGGGAYLNGQPISTSKVDSLVVTGFTHREPWMLEQGIEHLVNFMHRTQGFRRDGSASLDLCYLAAGRTDGFWEIGLNPWDIAAGVLIVREAGGKTTDFSGGLLDIYGNEILASNGLILEQMIDVLKLARLHRSEMSASAES